MKGLFLKPKKKIKFKKNVNRIFPTNIQNYYPKFFNFYIVKWGYGVGGVEGTEIGHS